MNNTIISAMIRELYNNEFYEDNSPRSPATVIHDYAQLLAYEAEIRGDEDTAADLYEMIESAHSNYDEMESAVCKKYDPCLLIDEDETNDTEAQFRSYVRQVVQCYVQELITADILRHGYDEHLIDLIGDIDVYIPDALCDYYKDKTIRL